jgi:hypothetical protein
VVHCPCLGARDPTPRRALYANCATVHRGERERRRRVAIAARSGALSRSVRRGVALDPERDQLCQRGKAWRIDAARSHSHRASMSWRLWLSIAATAVIGSTALAGASAEIVELRYAAPPGCPTLGAVEAAILARTSNVRFATPARRVFVITIRETADGFRGTLQIDERSTDAGGGPGSAAGGAGSSAGRGLGERSKMTGGGGPAGAAGGAVISSPGGIDERSAESSGGVGSGPAEVDKELEAQHCDDVANAFALVTALAIDPTATLVPRPAPPSPPPPPPAPPDDIAAIEVDVDAMVDAGVGPVAMFAAVIEARVRWRRDYRLELAAIIGRDSTSSEDGGEARFTWLAARPALCRRWIWHAMAYGGCGHAELGAVRASGQQIVNQRDLTRLWLAAGVHGSFGVPLYQNIFAQLQLGASVPLVRDRYIFAPNEAIHDTPFVTGWLVLGIGMQFR